MAPPDAPSSTPPRPGNRYWRWARRLFRGFRIGVLLLVLAAVVFGLYLNQVGLPNFLKRPLLAQLRDHGMELEFKRLRLHWYRGIVAEKVNFGRTGFVSGPELSLAEVELRLNYEALKRFQLQVDALQLRGGRLCWHFASTNQPAQPLALEEISAGILFQADDQWALEAFQARFNQARLKLSGTLAHASRWREFSAPTATNGASNRPPETADMMLRRFVNTLTNWHFPDPPELSVKIQGDVLAPQQLRVDLALTAPNLETPWGNFRKVSGSARLTPPASTQELKQVEIQLNLEEAKTKWGDGRYPGATARLRLTPSNTVALAAIEFKASRAKTPQSEWRNLAGSLHWPPVTSQSQERTELTLTATRLKTAWAEATNLWLAARWPGAFLALPASHQLVAVEAKATGINTEWGWGQQMEATAQLPPALWARQPAKAQGRMQWQNVHTRWGEGAQVRLDAQMAPCATNAALADSVVELGLERIKTEWGEATPAHLQARITHSLTNLQPETADGELRLEGAKTRWGTARQAHLALAVHPQQPEGSPGARADWGVWAKLEPVSLNWTLQMHEVHHGDLAVARAECAGDWHAPTLQMQTLTLALYDGRFNATGRLDVATRELRARCLADFDLQKITPLLTLDARRWLAQFAWEKPPVLSGEARLVLPAWTNQAPDWKRDVQPTLQLQGQFQGENGAFRNLAVAAAQAHFSYSNFTWRVPDLRAERPDGAVAADYTGNEQTKEFQWRIQSRLDPKILAPLLGTNEVHALDCLELTTPPYIEADIQGRWRQPQETVVNGWVALTNFTFRQEQVSELRTRVEFTNQLLTFRDAEIRRPGEEVRAGLVQADFQTQRVYLTNVSGRVDPGALTRAIGPKVAATMLPYRFGAPPLARAEGFVPLRGSTNADIIFEVADAPFGWWRFRTPKIAARAHWRGQSLVLTNVLADFYQGQLAGAAFFDFTATNGANFNFAFNVSNMHFHSFMVDVCTRSNKVEGQLAGELTITSGNTANFHGWDGYGWVIMRDGLIWDIPIFGLFSPMLNKVSAGLGNARASEGSATYVITNSVVYTDDLELRARTLRMQYEGTVDFDYNVNAQVEAELLRDTFLIGPLVRLVLKPLTKLFIYKVTGTLAEPKSEPLLIPKFLMVPLHPWRSLKGLFSPGEPETPAPAPPSTPETPPAQTPP